AEARDHPARRRPAQSADVAHANAADLGSAPANGRASQPGRPGTSGRRRRRRRGGRRGRPPEDSATIILTEAMAAPNGGSDADASVSAEQSAPAAPSAG